MLGGFFGGVFSFIKTLFSSWKLILKIIIAICCLIFIWYIFSKLNLLSPFVSLMKAVFKGIGGVFDFIKGLSPL